MNCVDAQDSLSQHRQWSPSPEQSCSIFWRERKVVCLFHDGDHSYHRDIFELVKLWITYVIGKCYNLRLGCGW
jgi:hypothetical protein